MKTYIRVIVKIFNIYYDIVHSQLYSILWSKSFLFLINYIFLLNYRELRSDRGKAYKNLSFWFFATITNSVNQRVPNKESTIFAPEYHCLGIRTPPFFDGSLQYIRVHWYYKYDKIITNWDYKNWLLLIFLANGLRVL